MQTTSSLHPTPPTTEGPDPAVSTDAEVGALTRLRLGTSTVHALIVNDKPIVALSEGALYVDPRYARTLTYWIESYESRYDEAVRLAGEERARVWKLYLRAARAGFTTGWASVYQVLASKPA